MDRKCLLVYTRGMLLGIDFGTAKVGLAVSDTDAGALPMPLSVVLYKKQAVLIKTIKKTVEEYAIEGFVVGTLPEKQAGDAKKQEAFNAFISTLKESFDLPFYYVDEQRSTKAAKSLGKDDPDFSEKRDDALAAQVILETYLASHGRSKN